MNRQLRMHLENLLLLAFGRTVLLCSALWGILALCAPASAQTLTTLKSFGVLTNVTGRNPHSQLVHGPDGTLYGTTRHGDANSQGTIFKVQPDGSGFTVLKWFTNSTEGANLYAGLTLSGSVLYGTTSGGGSVGSGTVFKLDLSIPLAIQSSGDAVVLSWAAPCLHCKRRLRPLAHLPTSPPRPALTPTPSLARSSSFGWLGTDAGR